ncbi:VanZ family protein [Streptomyces sp. H27-C3]|uniref:VanZ family protein n=1 Tax=Streptomyces sp. H27-C3 TaxID=3046305 RepID=UPI0024BB54E5|nr:VanZ family protein [Streptomyces sp. H27-C3]MDJ0464871.1 VanZ family protein [Streptomyces sp. H27-C3]
MTSEAGTRATWGQAMLRALAVALAFIGLVLFSAALARLTLVPSHASESLVTTNLRPGASLRQYAEDYTFLAACKQIGGNIVLGMPFGMLLPVLVPRSLRLIRVVAFTVVVMILVELAQGAIVSGRAFDVDDVILNTTGALIGYVLLGRRLGRIARARRGETKPGEKKPGEKRPGEKPRTSKPGTRKPWAKKPGTKKSWARKPGTRKPWARKPGAKVRADKA